MSKRFTVAAATMAVSLLASAPAWAFDPTGTPSGTHGCALADANGTPAPVAYPNSGTSQIGGNSCTYTQVDSNEPDPNGASGGSYLAAAQAWSVSACTPVVTNGTQTGCTPDGSWSSAAGSPNQAVHVIKPGDQVTVTVHNGTIISGVVNGAPGS